MGELHPPPGIAWAWGRFVPGQMLMVPCGQPWHHLAFPRRFGAGYPSAWEVRGRQGGFSPATRQLSLPVLLARCSARLWGGRGDALTLTLMCWEGPQVCPAPGTPEGETEIRLSAD